MSAIESAAETPLHLQARRVRKERKWTQQDVAERAGVSLRTYQLFENGQSRPQPANLRAILDALDLEAEGSEEPRWEPDVQAYLDTIGYYMESLSDKERRRFISTEHRRLVRQIQTAAAMSAERAEAEDAMRQALARRDQSDQKE